MLEKNWEKEGCFAIFFEKKIWENEKWEQDEGGKGSE